MRVRGYLGSKNEGADTTWLSCVCKDESYLRVEDTWCWMVMLLMGSVVLTGVLAMRLTSGCCNRRYARVTEHVIYASLQLAVQLVLFVLLGLS